MSQSLTTLAQSAYLNFTANAVRYIMIQKRCIKMSNQNQNQQKQFKSQPVPLSQQSQIELNQEIQLSGRTRRLAAENRAMYYSALGMCFTDVCQKICEEFKYKANSSFVAKIVSDARNLMKKKQEEYAENIAQRNIARIETIIQDCLNEGNRALALKAMDLLAKTGNVYNQTIKIDNNDNKSFEIKIENNQ